MHSTNELSVIMATQFVKWWKTKFHAGGCSYKTISGAFSGQLYSKLRKTILFRSGSSWHTLSYIIKHPSYFIFLSDSTTLHLFSFLSIHLWSLNDQFTAHQACSDNSSKVVVDTHYVTSSGHFMFAKRRSFYCFKHKNSLKTRSRSWISWVEVEWCHPKKHCHNITESWAIIEIDFILDNYDERSLA